MLLHCHSKKCNTTREHKLKVETDEAICMSCEENNGMVSAFMKNAMKASGDLYRSIAKKKAFMYKCSNCSVERGVKLVDEKAVCDTCSTPLNLSAPMIEAIRTMDSKLKDESGAKEEAVKGVVKRKKNT